MPTSASRIHVQEVGNVTVVTFRDRRIIDEPNIQKIGEEFFRLVDVLGRRNILIDFSNISYLSSAAIGKLLTLNKKVQAAGGKLVLCNLEPNVHEVLVVARVRALEVREWNPADDPCAELGGVWQLKDAEEN
jgi:anti-sigma B factor antagonist